MIKLPISVVFTLLGIEFAIFGWRINREINVVDKGRRVWLLLSDYANVASMVSVLVFCIVYPLSLASSPHPDDLPLLSRAVFSAAASLLIFHPVAMSAHYGVLPGQNGTRPANTKGEAAWCGRAEWAVNIVAWIAALVAGLSVYRVFS